MRIHFLAVLVLACVVFSCSNNEEELYTKKESPIETTVFTSEIQQFCNKTTGILSKLVETTNNYNTNNTRAAQADDDTLNQYVGAFAYATQAFLLENGIESSEIEMLDDGHMAYIGLMLIDYDKQKPSTRASAGECVLRGAGLGELAKDHVLSKKAVMRMLIKAGAKRAVPYIGWGLFVGETAACLMGY